MKTKEALKVIAEAIKNNTISDLRKSFIGPLKEAYGVSDLVFWKDKSNWFYCDYEFPKNWWGEQISKDSFDDLLLHLKWLHDGKGIVFFRSNKFESLKDLKEFILVNELSGLEVKNGR